MTAGKVASFFAGSPLGVVRLAVPARGIGLEDDLAAWTKTRVALLVSIRRTAAALGVEDDLANAWAISQPDLAAESLWAAAKRRQGWRWSYELAEVGRTFAAVGEPEGFGAAASQVFAASVNEDPPAGRAPLYELEGPGRLTAHIGTRPSSPWP